MKTVCTSKNIRESDRFSIESGTPSKKLMYNAAFGVYSYLKNKNLLNKNIAIICGRGNNGGDGFALADICVENSINPTLYVFKGTLSEDATYYKNSYCKKGGQVLIIDESFQLNNYEIIIDAIFGTGLNKNITGSYATIIGLINNSNALVVSCDIASGLNADNGFIMGVAVNATATITFASAKLGHYLGEGLNLSGELVVIDIGINILDKSINKLEKSDIKKFFKPLKTTIHKGDSGKSGIIGGSYNFIGAPLLASMGDSALKVGSGLSYLGIPDCIYDAVAKRVVNNIVYPFKSKNGVIVYDENTLSKFINLDSIAIGMGLGKCTNINKIIEFMLLNSDCKLLLDADALNNLDIEVLNNQKNRVLVTPHPKEFSRLLNVTTKEVLDNPVELAISFANKYNVTVLLKGATTIITNGKNVALNTKGSAGMAKGGSGDLLDGIILGLLARGFDVFESACGGAYIAGRSAELAVENGDINNFSMLPLDRLSFINTSINEIIED